MSSSTRNVARVVADQVDAGDVDAHAVGALQPARHPVEVRRRGDHRRGHDAVVEHLPGVVDVVEERLERPDPLLDAAVDGRPGVLLDDPRHDVEREGPLLAADVEGDALLEVRASRAPPRAPGPRRRSPGSSDAAMLS